MSTYPLLGYEITLPDDVNVTIEIGGTSDSLTIAAGTYWGWQNGTGDLSGTLAQAFIDELLTHSGWTSTPTASLEFVVDDSTQHARPYWQATFTGVASGDDFLYFASTSTLFDAALGFTDDETSPIDVLGYLRPKRRWLGCWSPGSLAAYPEPVYIDHGASARSDYDASAHDRVRVGRALMYLCEWDYVEAADISREIAGQSTGYLTLAERAVGDNFGTLDDLLGACGSNAEVRLIQSASLSRTCVLDASGDLKRDAYTTEEMAGARRYRVTLPLMLASEYDGVVT